MSVPALGNQTHYLPFLLRNLGHSSTVRILSPTAYTVHAYMRSSTPLRARISDHFIGCIGVMFLDTFHTLATVWMLWDFTVDNFGNLAVFAHLPWVYPTTPIFIVRLISYSPPRFPFSNARFSSSVIRFRLCEFFGSFLTPVARIVVVERTSGCSFDGLID